MRRTGPKTLCVFLLTFLFFFGPVTAGAASLTVAVMKSEGNFPVDDILKGFKAGLQQQFSVKLMIIDNGQDADKLSRQMDDIKPDMILCIGLKALERAAPISKIPKLYVMVTAENARPWLARSDIAGVTLDIASAHQFKIIRQALQDSKRIGVLYNPEYNRKTIDEARKAAASAGFSLVAQPVDDIRDIPLALQKLEGQIDLLWTIYDQTAYSAEAVRYILLHALRKKIPVAGLSPHFAKAGALLAIYGDYSDMGGQIAQQALAMRKGTESVAAMSRPRKVRIAINEKVGALLDIHFSDQFIKTVDQTY